MPNVRLSRLNNKKSDNKVIDPPPPKKKNMRYARLMYNYSYFIVIMDSDLLYHNLNMNNYNVHL